MNRSVRYQRKLSDDREIVPSQGLTPILLVVMQIEGDDEFNRWAQQAAQQAAEQDTPVAFVTIIEMKPVRSRIESLRLELAA